MTANPWISAADANTLTGLTALDDAKLNRAANDVYDYLRWDPDVTLDFLDAANPQQVRQKRVLGNAIAWTAAYHEQTSPAAQMSPTVLQESKTIGKYTRSVTYGSGTGGGSGSVLPARARNMLAAAGLCRWAGRTDAGVGDERRIRTGDDEVEGPFIPTIP